MYVVNDLHGAPALIDKTVRAIKGLKPGDTLIINGDGAGARGPIMNRIVKIFYEVRRGETDAKVLFSAVSDIVGEMPEIPSEWIFNSVHAGVFRKLLAERYGRFAECVREETKFVLEETLRPLSEAAKAAETKLVYLPGNGEIVPDDFTTTDISTEQTVSPADRFYQKLAKEGYFDQFGIDYVPIAALLDNSVALLSTNLLDLDKGPADCMLESHGLFDAKISKVVVHYPPAIAPIGGAFDFWTPNKSDVQRINALNAILAQLKLEPSVKIFFGHIHLGPNDPRMDPFPTCMGFRANGLQSIWVKPGSVLEI